MKQKLKSLLVIRVVSRYHSSLHFKIMVLYKISKYKKIRNQSLLTLHFSFPPLSPHNASVIGPFISQPVWEHKTYLSHLILATAFLQLLSHFQHRWWTLFNVLKFLEKALQCQCCWLPFTTRKKKKKDHTYQVLCNYLEDYV